MQGNDKQPNEELPEGPQARECIVDLPIPMEQRLRAMARGDIDSGMFRNACIYRTTCCPPLCMDCEYGILNHPAVAEEQAVPTASDYEKLSESLDEFGRVLLEEIKPVVMRLESFLNEFQALVSQGMQEHGHDETNDGTDTNPEPSAADLPTAE